MFNCFKNSRVAQQSVSRPEQKWRNTFIYFECVEKSDPVKVFLIYHLSYLKQPQEGPNCCQGKKKEWSWPSCQQCTLLSPLCTEGFCSACLSSSIIRLHVIRTNFTLYVLFWVFLSAAAHSVGFRITLINSFTIPLSSNATLLCFFLQHFIPGNYYNLMYHSKPFAKVNR